MEFYKKIELEIKDIKGYEGLYKVDNFGNVYSLPRKTTKGGKLKQQINKRNYCRVVLCKNNIAKAFSVHRLVAQAFIPNPQNFPQVNHKDENPRNNCVSNLEWCTAKYNCNYGTGIQRNSAARRGVPLSEERKRKISESEKGKKGVIHTEAARKKMSEAAKKYWNKWRAEHGKI